MKTLTDIMKILESNISLTKEQRNGMVINTVKNLLNLAEFKRFPITFKYNNDEEHYGLICNTVVEEKEEDIMDINFDFTPLTNLQFNDGKKMFFVNLNKFSIDKFSFEDKVIDVNFTFDTYGLTNNLSVKIECL
jgi:hypothetical protein